MPTVIAYLGIVGVIPGGIAAYLVVEFGGPWIRGLLGARPRYQRVQHEDCQ